jgi:hypothetical protein
MRIPANAKMALGTILHSTIPKILNNKAMASFYKDYVVKYEIECTKHVDTPALDIIGHCDVLLSSPERNEMVEEWKFSRSAARNGEDMPLYYAAQVNMYAVMLQAKKWRVNVVNPEDFKCVTFDGNVNEESANKMVDRAIKIHKVMTDESSPLNLLGRSYKMVNDNARSPSLRPLLDALVSSLPDGPEYEFECRTRSSQCPFYNICHMEG